MANRNSLTRRQFLRNTAVLTGGLALNSAFTRNLWAASTDTIRVGVIGCGGRGTGAAKNCVASSDGVKIVALADAFGDRLAALKKQFEVPDDRCFTGLDAYKAVLALADVNLVILATPPGFRPFHFAAAIAAGKHVFMEKPVAVCPTGIKMVLETSQQAAEKKLGVVAGTQRRHQAHYIEAMKRIHGGDIGTLVSAQCYWNQGGLWVKKREPGQSDVEWQLRNWLYFTWLSGDHIVEQHMHNIDVVNWAFNALPDSVHAVGGRQFRTGEEYGNIYDHFGAEFFYPGDVRTLSTCRQIQGADFRVSERIVGTKGVANLDNSNASITGEKPWKFEGQATDPYVQEHTDLIASIRSGNPLNEGKTVAESTLSAIMARESAYSMRQFTRNWFTVKCDLNLLPPPGLKLKDSYPVAPVAVPGKYQLAGWITEAPKKKQEGGKGKGKGKKQ
ncbi:MAG: Gfo/Idh/MocA family oxidoreductase [Verrucomicrobia bacterium]|nr:Gfo/Idh/MocA family oxidoreductase [Verrucomicrobiota bacterium]